MAANQTTELTADDAAEFLASCGYRHTQIHRVGQEDGWTVVLFTIGALKAAWTAFIGEPDDRGLRQLELAKGFSADVPLRSGI